MRIEERGRPGGGVREETFGALLLWSGSPFERFIGARVPLNVLSIALPNQTARSRPTLFCLNSLAPKGFDSRTPELPASRRRSEDIDRDRT